MPIQPDCLFCGEEPCAAHVGKPKKSSTRKPPAPKPSVSSPSPSQVSEKPGSSPWVASAPKASRFAAREKVELTEDELILREALKNLWPILSPTTKAKYASLVEPPKDASMTRRKSEIRRVLRGDST